MQENKETGNLQLDKQIDDEHDLGLLTKDFEEPITTKRELWGWYMCGFANEPFYVVFSAVFQGIILETLSSAAGVELSDGKTPCDTTKPDYKCLTYFGSGLVDSTSFALYITVISSIIQLFVYISLGALADHGNFRKKFLLIFSYLGAASLVLFLAVRSPSLYPLAAALTIISGVFYGASIVFWYAFLPILTRHHPDVVSARREGELSETEVNAISDSVCNKISGVGFALGYLGGVIMLLLAAILVYVTGQTIYSMQIATALTGVWWAGFMTFTLLWLKPRPGPPLPRDTNFVVYSWKKTFETFRHAKMLSETFKLLITWFLFSDALNTIVTIAVFFGKKSIGMTQLQLLIAALEIPFVAMLGNYFWLFIQRKTKLRTKSMMMILMFLYLLVPVYGLLGFALPIGLKSIPELYVVAGVHGLLLGASQSYIRVLFAELIPSGYENEFFALYEITDKGSSWLGPLVIGVISQATHELRYSMIFIFGMFLLALVIMSLVNMEKGKKEAKEFKFFREEKKSRNC
ncbi:uncharacterized protein VTP21DRAFT_2795 [Calcarisporiella thermophila]|uniref:uncharacterized protein n=1 Tax=Calcarisporiella thermophila TaxID=911321 RepID=UPI0037428067